MSGIGTYLYFKEKKAESCDTFMNGFCRILEGYGQTKWTDGMMSYIVAWDEAMQENRQFDAIQTVAFIGCFGQEKAKEMWKSAEEVIRYDIKLLDCLRLCLNF